MNVDTTELSKLPEAMKGKIDLLLFSVSYERRSSVIWNSIWSQCQKQMAFYNSNHDYLKTSVEDVKKNLPSASLVPINSDNPVGTFDKLRQVMSGFHGPVKVGLDITCFTREALAMLLLVLRHSLPEKSTLLCLYTVAAEYTASAKNKERDGWLSRGIAEVRSVLGYRGHVSLLATTHLIILPGFEVDRAQSIVDTLQPDRLTIGQLPPSENVSPQFTDRAAKMAERLRAYYPEQHLSNLSFSAKNPFATRDALLSVLVEQENTIVACLNTKIATVGVCMAAQSKSCVQLVYAQPVQYNVTDFAVPSTTIISFPFDLTMGAATPSENYLLCNQ